MALIVAAAIIADGALLAARRGRGPYSGLWEFPGGKVEPGESDHQALARELGEELGVTGAIGKQVGGDWPLADGHIMHVYRFALDPGQEPRCLDIHDALRMVTPGDAYAVDWIPADLPIVAEVIKTMNG